MSAIAAADLVPGVESCRGDYSRMRGTLHDRQAPFTVRWACPHQHRAVESAEACAVHNLKLPAQFRDDADLIHSSGISVQADTRSCDMASPAEFRRARTVTRKVIDRYRVDRGRLLALLGVAVPEGAAVLAEMRGSHLEVTVTYRDEELAG